MGQSPKINRPAAPSPHSAGITTGEQTTGQGIGSAHSTPTPDTHAAPGAAWVDQPVTDEQIADSVRGLNIQSRTVRVSTPGPGPGFVAGGQADAHQAKTTESEQPESPMPTSGQSEEGPICPPVGKTDKPRKKRQLQNLPTSGQDELKPLMPTLPTGFWWECPADDKGFTVKVRWRGGQPPNSHVFARVGKYEFQTWKELDHESRQWIINDRLTAELLAKGKRSLAARLGFIAGDD